MDKIAPVVGYCIYITNNAFSLCTNTGYHPCYR